MPLQRRGHFMSPAVRASPQSAPRTIVVPFQTKRYIPIHVVPSRSIPSVTSIVTRLIWLILVPTVLISPAHLWTDIKLILELSHSPLPKPKDHSVTTPEEKIHAGPSGPVSRRVFWYQYCYKAHPNHLADSGALKNCEFSWFVGIFENSTTHHMHISYHIQYPIEFHLQLVYDINWTLPVRRTKYNQVLAIIITM